MVTTEYLYDCQPSDFAYLSYIDAIQYKKQQADDLYKKLTKQEEKFYHSGSKYDELADLRLRIAEVNKAINHNRKLLDELNENQ